MYLFCAVTQLFSVNKVLKCSYDGVELGCCLYPSELVLSLKNLLKGRFL